jgi:SAM-dependent methyltransferase
MDDTDYALGRTNVEYERLIEQAELLRPLTERLIRAAGIGPGMHVLDVGCGMGDVSFLVSDIVGPEGSVLGVDLDGTALKFANQRRAARGIANVVFREGDARSVGSERLFDAAVGRFVLMYMSDPTAALRLVAERVRPGGILAFHEWVAGISPASAMNLPVLASFQNLVSRTFLRSGARVDIGAELYWRMCDAGLDPEPRPVAEIAICTDQGEVGYRRWALFARSMLPKIVEYGLATEEEVVDTVERQLRDELVDARLTPLSWLMIGQWARKTHGDRVAPAPRTGG